jgi:hypothetical protein
MSEKCYRCGAHPEASQRCEVVGHQWTTPVASVPIIGADRESLAGGPVWLTEDERQALAGYRLGRDELLARYQRQVAERRAEAVPAPVPCYECETTGQNCLAHRTADPAPVTKRCPACGGKGTRPLNAVFMRNDEPECEQCHGTGLADPAPVTESETCEHVWRRDMDERYCVRCDASEAGVYQRTTPPHGADPAPVTKPSPEDGDYPCAACGETHDHEHGHGPVPVTEGEGT